MSVSDSFRINFLKMIERDEPVHASPMSWKLQEYSKLPQTNLIWRTFKMANHLEKPLYPILAYQIDGKNQMKKDTALYTWAAFQI